VAPVSKSIENKRRKSGDIFIVQYEIKIGKMRNRRNVDVKVVSKIVLR
jgi:hypothetical protein